MYCTAQGPTADWNDYIRDQEQRLREMEPEHTCDNCEEGFNEGDGGQLIDGFHFCPICIKGNQHIVFFRDKCNLTIKEAAQSLLTAKPL